MRVSGAAAVGDTVVPPPFREGGAVIVSEVVNKLFQKPMQAD